MFFLRGPLINNQFEDSIRKMGIILLQKWRKLELNPYHHSYPH